MTLRDWPPLAAVIPIALSAIGLPAPAGAITLQCVPREAIFENLERSSGEVPAHAGVTSTGALFEVLVSPDGSWTAFFTFPDGLTCPVATGEGWRRAPASDHDPAA
ncbi:hypothetical protein AAFN88_12875 [Pelagibius sp. CAU 1746]|uniref:hypothetical protein n=1 Tax=Pelagibius sp. CAU 1746 TaxID=3140370 RepID=UPI00325B4BC7